MLVDMFSRRAAAEKPPCSATWTNDIMLVTRSIGSNLACAPQRPPWWPPEIGPLEHGTGPPRLSVRRRKIEMLAENRAFSWKHCRSMEALPAHPPRADG